MRCNLVNSTGNTIAMVSNGQAWWIATMRVSLSEMHITANRSLNPFSFSASTQNSQSTHIQTLSGCDLLIYKSEDVRLSFVKVALFNHSVGGGGFQGTHC